MLEAMGRITPAGAGKTLGVWPPRLMSMDHPRRCGENNRSVKHLAFCPGSPPQVRGKRQQLGKHRQARRITPAGAGKTGMVVGDAFSEQDHPRRCGENVFLHFDSFQKMGSPPQVRGKRFPYRAHDAENRITPAGAGKTLFHAAEKSFLVDHPRRCGENTKKIL